MGVPLVGGSANPVYLVDGNGNTVSSPNNSTVTPSPSAIFVVNDPGLPDTLGIKSATNSTSVISTANATILQASLVTSTSAAQLTATPTPCSAVEVYNLALNAINVLVGNSSTQLREVVPGAAFTIAIDDVSKVYVKAASGTPTIVWTARAG